MSIVIFDDTLSPQRIEAGTMHRRAVSVASRMLGGSGRAELLAFRAQPQHSIEILAHGLLPDGTFVVAATFGDRLEDGPEHLDVRLDVEKDAPEIDLRIRAATLHALGRLSWLEDSVASDLGGAGRLPGLVGSLVGLPGVRIGKVDLARVLLHDCAGVTPLPWRELQGGDLGAPFPQSIDELSAAEAVSSMPSAAWIKVIEAVVTGRLPGEVLKRWELPAVCEHTVGTVRCVDVDATGVTMMHLTAVHAATVFVPFASPVDDVDGVRDALSGLFASDVLA